MFPELRDDYVEKKPVVTVEEVKTTKIIKSIDSIEITKITLETKQW